MATIQKELQGIDQLDKELRELAHDKQALERAMEEEAAQAAATGRRCFVVILMIGRRILIRCHSQRSQLERVEVELGVGIVSVLWRRRGRGERSSMRWRWRSR